ncbi:MAG: hypothetical protein BZY88_02405 [SAR202 cluster bacterium Io17-Chloro-G9]|nr:MAG: hypothetical protein BZY88_02405 [SAR202 cluster bacterium Io17-Chloro-G9]
MTLRGAFAKPQAAIPLGPEPGLSVSVDDGVKVDGDAVYGLLSQPSRDRSTGIHATPGDVVFGGLALWLSLRESGLCGIHAEGHSAGRAIEPCLLEYPGEGRRCWTIGLLGDEDLCVFVRSTNQAFSSEELDVPQNLELLVRNFGPQSELGDRLVQQVIAWDGAGRPASEGLRIRVYPNDASYVPSANEFLVRKRWTQLVLDWE